MEPVVDDDISTASISVFVEASYNDVINITDEANSGILSSYKTLSNCSIIQRDSANHTDADSIIIDFGTTNCICNDSINRRGKIIVAYTKKYTDSASVHTITFSDYYVNDNKIDGTKTVKNKGHNSSKNLNWDITANGTITLSNNEGIISWVSVRNREKIFGDSTSIWSDDKYSLTGTSSGTTANGINYTVNIINPLIRDMSASCMKYFVKGTFDFSPSGKLTRTVNFGDGTCDNKVTVTIAGKIYQMNLK